MKIEVRYSWRFKRGKRTVMSSIKMTEERARREDPEAVRLDHTREEVAIWDQPCEIDEANSNLVARCVGTTAARLSRLHRPKTLPQEAEFVPLPLAAVLYQVSNQGDVWKVISTSSSPHRVVYQGRGPVTVEPAP